MKIPFALPCARIFSLVLLLAIPHQYAPGQQPGPAAGPSQQSIAQEQAAGAAPATKIPAVPDVVVLDQENRKLHFYTDLVQGKTVAINFVFTTCTTICPPLTANFARIQKIMKARGQNGLTLISVTVDPENDTPARLKSYAALFHAQPGWAFVTGDRADLEQIWKAFNIKLSSKQDHPPTVAIGNDPQHVWVYASGLTTADKLMGAITPVLAEKKPASPAQEEAAAKRAGRDPQ